MPLTFTQATFLTALLHLPRLARGAILTIDDADPRIQYVGSWVPNSGGDPQQLNYLATLTYSNVSGAVASFQFTGSAVAVYGAFGPVGTFDMRSEYSIDRGPPTVFLPPGDIAAVVHRRQFFASGEIKYGPHVLTIENMGEQFWLDFIQVEAPDDPGTTQSQTASATAAATEGGGTSTSTQAVASRGTSSDGAASTALASPRPTASSALPSSSSTEFRPASAPSATSTQGSALTQENASLTVSPAAEIQSSTSPFVDASQLSTPTPSESQATGGGALQGKRLSVGSPTIRPGAIEGVAIAGVLMLLAVVAALLWWRRRSSGQGVVSFGNSDPEHPEESKGGNAAREREPHDIVLQGAQALSVAVEDRPREDNASQPNDDRNSAAVLRSQQRWQHSHRGQDSRENEKRTGPARDVPLSPAAGVTTRDAAYIASLINGSARTGVRRSSGGRRRRSVDGGLRLAGGPPGEDVAEQSRSSVASTLPPSYQMYHT